jgi:hypothetical protein
MGIFIESRRLEQVELHISEETVMSYNATWMHKSSASHNTKWDDINFQQTSSYSTLRQDS